jgi:cellulose synthase/poly-beta-1,6-N-acetylglucosamine synthase-like glycosyltransferase
LYPSDTHFLNSTEALVQTSSVSTWKELIQQRIRWAGKTSKIHNDYLKRTGLLVFSMNVILLITLLFSLLGFGWFKLLRVFFVSKLIFDTALVYATAQVLKQRFNFVSWLLSSLAYPFFSVYIVVKSLVLNNYEWKERMFEK